MTSLGILHLTTFLQGGAGRAITDLASAQHAAGHRVTVVTSAHGVAGFENYPEYLERLTSAGVPLYQFDSLFTRDLALNLQVVESLRKYVAPREGAPYARDGVGRPFTGRHTIDVIHAHAAVPALIGRLFAGYAAHRIPVVQTQHGWGSNKTAVQAQMDLAILRAVDRVVTTSRATRDLLARLGTPPESVSVIPCGVPLNDTVHPPAEARALVESLHARGLCVVGCVGTVNANKNQRLIVGALPRLPQVAAVFIGEGSESLLDEARAMGVEDRVIACGYQKRASGWLPLFDAVVVPSRTEGQGLIVLEAFRAGVQVVASDIAALAEVVEDGRTGFLFESDSVVALAAAVNRALSADAGDRAEVLARARHRFAADFTINRMVTRHQELYEDVNAYAAI